MAKGYVDFISDDHYKECVRHVLNAFNNAASLKTSLEKEIKKGNIFKSSLFNNVVDPFKMIFEVQKIGIKEWVRKEILRQLDKSVEQRMGEFHQKILGGVKGWQDMKVGKGIDLINEEQTIFIELKNKYNTCSDSALKEVRGKLEKITSAKHNSTAYWAFVIADTKSKSGEEIWLKKGFNKIENVKKIWGEKVYELVTGNPYALQQIYETLPQVITDVVKEDDIKDISKIIDEIMGFIEEHLENIQKQIYSQVFTNLE